MLQIYQCFYIVPFKFTNWIEQINSLSNSSALVEQLCVKFLIINKDFNMINYTFSLKLLQIFGLHFVDLKTERFQSKFEKCLTYHAYFYNFVVIFASTTVFLNFIRVFSGIELSTYYMEVILCLSMFLVGIATYFLTFYFRKNDQKFWKIYSEIENLNEIFLKVSMNPKAFKFYHCLLISYLTFVFVINLCRFFITSFRLANDFNEHYHPLRLLITHLSIFMIKYIFYVKIITEQLKNLRDYGDLTEENFLVFQRILTNLWQMSRKIEKAFQYQMLIIIITLMFSSIFTGYFLAYSILNDGFIKVAVLFLSLPFLVVAYVSIPSENCINVVSEAIA